MNLDDLNELLAGGETFTTEFKTDPFNDSSLVEAIVCLANGDGGRLLIGVTDDGNVVGAQRRHETVTDPARLRALIANKTDPAVITLVEVLSDANGDVIVISVPASASVVGTKDGRFVRRAIDVHGKPQCLPMRPNEVLERAGSIGAHDYSAVALPEAARSDLDASELDRFRWLASHGGDTVLGELSNDDLLRALGVVTTNTQITVAAILLFGTSQSIATFVPTHEVAFQVVDSLQVRINKIERWPLVRAMEEVLGLITPFNPEEEIEIGLFRIGLPRYAEAALRELLANAFVHRDYSTRGAVQVQLEDDELRVVSPGSFPAGITPQNVLVAPPRARNPLLADVFKRAGLVERTGRGVNRVFASQLAAGHPPPDYGRSTSAWVEARLRGGPADRMLAAYIAETNRTQKPLRLNDLLVLHEVRRERRITSTRASALLQLGQDDTRSVLNDLVERGLLEARGERNGRSYHLAAAVYQRLGEEAAYVRTAGFSATQQQQMIMKHVETYGSITRAQVIELCQLSAGQASNLLRRLRDEGTLELVGERRGAKYTKPAMVLRPSPWTT